MKKIFFVLAISISVALTVSAQNATVKDGAVTYHYENGKVMETGAFINNDKTGQWLRWDEAGHKIAEAYYVNGKKNGTWLVWDANGTKRYEMHYEMSAKVGTWFMWDENGKLTSEKNYNAL
jgi:antitoxin component YwqK of YwqJK toxin-antitoxin module